MYRFLAVLTLTFVLLGAMAITCHAADIVWVHQTRGQEGEGSGTAPDAGQGTLEWEDDQWRALLEDNGHTIVEHDMFDDLDVAPEGLDVLNSADLVIFSRDSNSGDYNTFDEQEAWTEGVTVPMIVMTPYVVRNTRWDMVPGEGIVDAFEPLEAVEPDHPIFCNVPLDDLNQMVLWEEGLLGPDDNIDLLNLLDFGDGQIIAQEADTELPWIVFWETGAEFYDGSTFSAGGPRLFFSAGSDDDPYSWGEKNITETGDQLFLNAVAFMTGSDPCILTLPGDYDGNGDLDAGDLDLQAIAISTGEHPKEYDLNDDDLVNYADRQVWVDELKKTWIGDSNLDLQFSSGDMVQVFVRGKYETGEGATWEDGDWNGDLKFSSGDMVAAFVAGGYEKGERAAAGVSVVPEPASGVLLLLGCVFLGVLRRR